MTDKNAMTIPFARPWITDIERNAVMQVLHGDTQEILLQGTAEDGFWESIWQHIHKNLDVTYRAGV